jgi:hypothetical protein
LLYGGLGLDLLLLQTLTAALHMNWSRSNLRADTPTLIGIINARGRNTMFSTKMEMNRIYIHCIYLVFFIFGWCFADCELWLIKIPILLPYFYKDFLWDWFITGWCGTVNCERNYVFLLGLKFVEK